MKSDRKQTILFIIILLILSMGIGYAFLTTTLSIDGVSDVDASVWDVHWENIQVFNTSISGEQVISPATIGNNGTSVSYHIKLNEPGEFYAFQVDVVNDGTLNAKIESISINVNGLDDLPSYLIYEALYASSGARISVGDYLLAGSFDTYLFGVGYNADVSEEDLPTEDVSLSFSVNITYVQAPKIDTFYTNSTVHIRYNESLPSGVPVYSSYFSAANNYDDAFLKIHLTNDLVDEMTIGFIYENQVYYLKGLGATINESNGTINNDSLYFESNVVVLNGIFGNEKCSYVDGGNTYECIDYYHYMTHTFRVKKNGYVYAFTVGHYVTIESYGEAYSNIYIPH